MAKFFLMCQLKTKNKHPEKDGKETKKKHPGKVAKSDTRVLQQQRNKNDPPFHQTVINS